MKKPRCIVEKGNSIETALKVIKKNKVMVALFPCSGAERRRLEAENSRLINENNIPHSRIHKIDRDIERR